MRTDLLIMITTVIAVLAFICNGNVLTFSPKAAPTYAVIKKPPFLVEEWTCGCKTELHPDEFADADFPFSASTGKGALVWKVSERCNATAHVLDEKTGYTHFFPYLQGSSQEWGFIDLKSPPPGIKLSTRVHAQEKR